MVKEVKIYGQSASKIPLRYGITFNDYRKQSSANLTNVTIYDIMYM